MNPRNRLFLSLIISSGLSIILGVFSNLAAETIKIEDPKTIWTILTITFVISLPFSYFILSYGSGSKAKLKSSIPAKTYSEFFGRQTQLIEILEVFRDPLGKRILCVDGLGGIGKTALIREIAGRSMKEGIFSEVIWLASFESINIESEETCWNDVLTLLGEKLGVPNFELMELEEKKEIVSGLLQPQKILIVFDNLESIREFQNSLITNVLPLLGGTRMVFLSRVRFKGDAYGINLGGLDRESSIALMRFEATQRGMDRVAAADHVGLGKLYKILGGSPLAIKLIVGQLRSLSVEDITRSLSDLKKIDRNQIQAEYFDLFKSIYLTSWNLLSRVAKKMLLSISVFSLEEGASFKALEEISSMDEDQLIRAIDELWTFSFLDLKGSGVSRNKSRYVLHPLTASFLKSEIVR